MTQGLVDEISRKLTATKVQGEEVVNIFYILHSTWQGPRASGVRRSMMSSCHGDIQTATCNPRVRMASANCCAAQATHAARRQTVAVSKQQPFPGLRRQSSHEPCHLLSFGPLVDLALVMGSRPTWVMGRARDGPLLSSFQMGAKCNYITSNASLPSCLLVLVVCVPTHDGVYCMKAAMPAIFGGQRGARSAGVP